MRGKVRHPQVVGAMLVLLLLLLIGMAPYPVNSASTREADDFTLEFGFPPDYEYGADTDQAVPNLITSGSFALANTGDEIVRLAGNPDGVSGS